MKLDATKILEHVINQKASDLHLAVGVSPFIRINTKLIPLQEYGPLTTDDVDYFLSQVLDEDQRSLLEINKELDFSVALGNKARFRVNAFYQKGYPSVALRTIPMQVPSIKDLNLPDVVENLCELRQGLVLVVGPTGHGKSTTLASMIDKINTSRAEHIVTIEDPIEYIFNNKLSLIEQREMYIDSHSWDVALKSVLRQDPNIVLVGELRDYETMAAALQVSETGHLVLGTLHTNSASQTVERIINSFPEATRSQIRMQLAQVLEVVISQRLLPSQAKGMVPATEIMLATDAVRNLIREGKTHMIDNIIGTSLQSGMMTLDRSLAVLVEKGWIDVEDALKVSLNPDEVRRLLKNVKYAGSVAK
jgi:twitching motility protein PilT